MIQAIYDEMWERFEKSIVSNQYEIDKNINSSRDLRRGITALSYLNENSLKTTEKICAFTEEIKEIEPSLYVQPVNEIHLTILSIISCVDGFTLSSIDENRYMEVFQESMRTAEPITIQFKGISASPSCIVIQGYSDKDRLNELRDSLRNNFRDAGLHYTFDTRYKLTTAHSTVVRFSNEINNCPQLLKFCQENRERDFGRVELSSFDLVYNDWYQSLGNTIRLSKYSAI